MYTHCIKIVACFFLTLLFLLDLSSESRSLYYISQFIDLCFWSRFLYPKHLSIYQSTDLNIHRYLHSLNRPRIHFYSIKKKIVICYLFCCFRVIRTQFNIYLCSMLGTSDRVTAMTFYFIIQLLVFHIYYWNFQNSITSAVLLVLLSRQLLLQYLLRQALFFVIPQQPVSCVQVFFFYGRIRRSCCKESQSAYRGHAFQRSLLPC